MKKLFIPMELLSVALLCAGCFETKHEIKTESEIKPIEIKPIHITLDINIKVDKALDDFFDDIDK